MNLLLNVQGKGRKFFCIWGVRIVPAENRKLEKSSSGLVFYVEPAALLVFAVLLYCLPLEELAAYLLAFIWHESGHVLALAVFGVKKFSFHVQVGGLLLEYEGELRDPEALLCAFAGPLTGFLFAWVFLCVGVCRTVPVLHRAAWISFCLSVFNLLPAVPLDGGVVLKTLIRQLEWEERGLLLYTSGLMGVLLIVGGLFLRPRSGYGLLFAGLYLLWYLIFQEGIVK